jgi:anaerobic magnesium-protoporphyrin IX monomethyl ester cyclase
MRFSKILLINPSYAHYKLYDPCIPVSLGYIAQALSDDNIDYDLIDMSLGYDQFTLKSKIKKFKPDLIGITMYTLLYKKIYEFIKYIKKTAPLAKIVVGGPHASTLREEVLKECNTIDYAVVLAGEEVIVELCRDKALADIKGLIYREGENILFNGTRPLPENLDTYSFPRYKKFELKKYWFTKYVPMLIVSSRGCPYRCTFCISRPSGGYEFHARRASNVVDEIQYWHNQGRFVFDFVDDNFTLDKERVYLICDEIKKRSLDKLQYRLTNGIRADNVDREILERMKKVGFRSLAFGVESGSDKILKSIKKGETISQINEAVRDACDLGYDVGLYFLVGSPYETWDDLNASFDFALKYPIYEAVFFNIIPIPNTELYEWIKKNNLFIYPPQHYLNESQIVDKRPVFQTSELPLRERKRALLCANSISKRIKKRYYQALLSKYGIFGKLFSVFATSDFVRKRLMYIPILKKSLRITKRLLISKDKFT